mgnify:CR=1 FL=1
MARNAERRAALCLLLAATAPVVAQDRFGEGLDVSLSVHRSEQELRTGGLDYETRITRLGLEVWERSLPGVQLGLSGGPLWLTQSGNAATAGRELTGYFVGVGARGTLFSSPLLDFGVGLDYAYHRAEDDSAGRNIQLAWHQVRVEAGTTLKLERLRLLSGVYGLYLDGDQTGSDLATDDLETDRNVGGYLGAEYWLDAGGHIGVRGEAGAYNALSLTFARRF